MALRDGEIIYLIFRQHKGCIVMDNFNIKLNTLKNDLVNTIKQSEIPVGVVYFLLKDLLNDVANVYKQTLVVEQQVASLNNEVTENNNNKN